MTEQNFFNLDKPYRYALLLLISVCTTFLGVIAWFLVKEVDINRRQTEILSDTQKDISLIIQKNNFQDEKIEKNTIRIIKTEHDLDDLKKKIYSN